MGWIVARRERRGRRRHRRVAADVVTRAGGRGGVVRGVGGGEGGTRRRLSRVAAVTGGLGRMRMRLNLREDSTALAPREGLAHLDVATIHL